MCRLAPVASSMVGSRAVTVPPFLRLLPDRLHPGAGNLLAYEWCRATPFRLGSATPFVSGRIAVDRWYRGPVRVMASAMIDQELVRVALVNDYELVVAGMAAVLGRYTDRLVVADAIVIGEEIEEPVDVALYDTFGREGVAEAALRTLVNNPNIRRVAVFSMDLHPDLIADARGAGAHGFISKALPGDEIADALVRIARGESLVAGTPSPRQANPDFAWPGKEQGLTERESEVLVLLAEGLSNREIAAALYIGTETVKGYVSQALRKLDLRNRVQAASYVHRTAGFERISDARPPDRG